MERNLYDNELEDFLKRKTDQYKLYPSDRVWSTIYKTLHTGRKWHITGGSLLLIGIITLISLQKKIPDLTSNNTARKNTIITGAAAITGTSSNRDNTTISDSKTPIAIHSKKNRLIKAGKLTTEPDQETTETFMAIPQLSLLTVATIETTPKNSNINIQGPNVEKHPVNWLEETVINRLTTRKSKRSKLQFYLSPTISYRSLRTGNSANHTNSISNSGLRALVNQAPALGLEIGSALQFPVTDNFLVKAGLQLNYIRYNINAYRSSPERTSVTLSGTGYYSPPTTITTYSTLNNYNNGFPETIQSKYMQLSLPLGVEWKLLDNKRLQLNVAGSVQPTYLLMNNAYLLTSDYSKYIKESSLMRRWNINTGLETFVSYQSGSLRWQVGPQFRYQLLSSYTNRYPVREHLMEYGMKIGVSKTINR